MAVRIRQSRLRLAANSRAAGHFLGLKTFASIRVIRGKRVTCDQFMG